VVTQMSSIQVCRKKDIYMATASMSAYIKRIFQSICLTDSAILRLYVDGLTVNASQDTLPLTLIGTDIVG